MPHRKHSTFHGDARTFDNALQQIRNKLYGDEVDAISLKACVRKLTTLADNGPELARGHPELMWAVDLATSVRYPHHEPWNHATRSELLMEQSGILLIASEDGVVDRSELEHTANFLRAMRDQLHKTTVVHGGSRKKKH